MRVPAEISSKNIVAKKLDAKLAMTVTPTTLSCLDGGIIIAKNIPYNATDNELSAVDDAKEIFNGRHERFIVNREKFLSKVYH